jgi:exopolysaccharide biosynthesis WecB/TagA/CpsF family protein
MHRDETDVFGERHILFCDVGQVCKLVGEYHEKMCWGQINFVNPHSVVLASQDVELSRVLRWSLANVADGVGLVLGNCIMGLAGRKRCAGPDFMDAFLASGLVPVNKQFFIGGVEWDGSTSASRIVRRYGFQDQPHEFLPGRFPFCPNELDEIVSALHRLQPSLVWVGLGTRKQEITSNYLLARYPNALYVNVGAAFDFLSGRIRRSPLWVRKCGLEWAFRLSVEPQRLAARNWDSLVYLAHAIQRRNRMRRQRLE